MSSRSLLPIRDATGGTPIRAIRLDELSVRNLFDFMTKSNSASAKTIREPMKPSRKTKLARSTARNVARSAAGWKGDDLEDVMKVVAASRTKSRF